MVSFIISLCGEIIRCKYLYEVSINYGDDNERVENFTARVVKKEKRKSIFYHFFRKRRAP